MTKTEPSSRCVELLMNLQEREDEVLSQGIEECLAYFDKTWYHF